MHKRLSQPSPDNLNYGIIGNCKSSALIYEDSSIDWCCLPQFDSPSVFGKILDDKIKSWWKISKKSFNRFTFEKFQQTEPILTTQMKSVGEVMAIGRTFQESMQKALRGLEVGVAGFDPQLDLTNDNSSAVLRNELAEAGPDRIWYLADGFRSGMSIKEMFAVTKVDPWFLVQIKDLITTEDSLKTVQLHDLDYAAMFALKRKGFADERLAVLLGVPESKVREHRHSLGIRPVYKRVDTCAAEFEAATPYYYSCYDREDE